MSKKKKIKKYKKKFLKLLLKMGELAKQVPPKYWNKQF